MTLARLKYQLHILEAMANNRKDGIDKVNGLLNPIIKHLIKIAIYSHSKDRAGYVTHWEDEILEWLFQVDEYCNNLKQGGRLKLKDYMTCLQDDLARDRLVESKCNHIAHNYKGLVLKTIDYSLLRRILWQVLELQFKEIANDSWNPQCLLSNSDYVALKSLKWF